MAERPTTPASPPAHADHDAILVAALSAGDLTGSARADAEALVAACTACATLHADLRAIAAATKALPAPVRTRDFRLTPAQAQRLRPSAPRRWLEALASPRLAVTKPLAVTFTTLGIAGLLLTAIPVAGPAGLLSAVGDRVGAGGAEQRARDVEGAGEGMPGASAAPGFAASPSDDANVLGPESTTAPEASPYVPQAVGGGDTRDTGTALVPDQGPWLLVLSLAMLGVGLGLFVARRLGRTD